MLELFIQVPSETRGGEASINRVIVEMNVEEAREFVGRLASIEKVRNWCVNHAGQ